ncbi:MAG TPA: YaeQ family protein [Spirochaetia bacterium]|nr:YaeQ family protein [Spirochaetia bacterium]
MALPSTIYRFKIALSDSDRGVFQNLDLRVPMHSSEAGPYFITRVLAYLLNWEEGIEMMQGIDSPDDPAIQVKDLTGKYKLWLDVGSPAPKRLHKAAKLAGKVKVYAYKDPGVYLREMAKEDVHRFSEIEFHSFPPEFLKDLERTLERDNAWEVTVSGGTLYIRAGDRDVQGEVKTHTVG